MGKGKKRGAGSKVLHIGPRSTVHREAPDFFCDCCDDTGVIMVINHKAGHGYRQVPCPECMVSHKALSDID